VTMDWDARKGRLVVKIVPKINCRIDIYFNSEFKKLKGKDLRLDSQNALRGVSLVAGKTVSYEFG